LISKIVTGEGGSDGCLARACALAFRKYTHARTPPTRWHPGAVRQCQSM